MQQETKETKLQANGNGRTVLVVDDDELVAGLMRRYLMWRGYDVLTAGNGKEALDALAAAPGIAAVLLDVDMPGMDGREALPLIREAHPAAHVIMCSGFEHFEPDEFIELGAEHCLRKPFRMDALLAVMDHALSQ